MKTIRNFMILAGLSVAIVAIGAIGAKAEWIPLPEFTGSFTLPVQARWGSVTLPAGDYSFYYGASFKGGPYAVEVVSKADGSVRGMFLVRARKETSASKNALVCTREGNVDIVRALDLPALGESINFSLPPNTELMANRQGHNATNQTAELEGLTQRIPVTPNRS